MERRTGLAAYRRGSRRLGILIAAAALALVAAVPAFAQNEGGSLEPQIVGGDSVPNGKYSFMTSLQGDFPGDGTSANRHFCGATLIDRGHILTAGHCADVIGGGGGLPVNKLRVVVGITMLGSGQGQARSVDSIRDVAIHPRFRILQSHRYDAAVIELDRPITGINPIKLLSPGKNWPERAGNKATITGWGNTKAQPAIGGGGENFPKRMQEGHTTVASDRAGKRAYGGEYVPKLMVAAGKGKVGACQGDSGGPMFDRVSGKQRQFGITSFGRGCAAKNSPVVYTEVNAPAITRFIKRESGR